MGHQSTKTPKRVLLVEDNPADAQLTTELLTEAEPGAFTLARVETLAEAKAQLAEGDFDLMLLDLGLPDSVGIETLDAIMPLAADVAVVVLSGQEDEQTGAEAIARGAQDFLTKGFSEVSRLLARTLNYAVERRVLLRRLEQAELEAGRVREQRAMERLTPAGHTPVAASMFGAMPLRTSHPDAFGEMLSDYRRLIEQSVERQVYKVEHPINDGLDQLADNLGFLRAGPRDLVELHTQCLRKLIAAVGQSRERLVTEEGRYLLLELMGRLAAYYRRFYPGARGPART